MLFFPDRKNWAQCYVVTTGQMLYFYKDQKATNAKPNQPMGKPEVTIDLRDAEIIYTSEVVLARKNIIIVKTRSGTDEYMLQHDKSEEIHVWNQTLKGNIESLAKYSGRPTTLTLPHQRSVDTLPGSDHHSPVTESANTTLPRKKASPRDRMTGTATLERTNNTGKLYITDDADGTRRIKDWLTNWFKKRPPVETLRAKGIIQDAVFGSHLMSLYIKEDGKVPHFVIGCIAAIEDRGE
ncbi:hypothetical protein LSAT2_031097 [Lamellibrachia satsuma]|nr:hypothetical protein LSAT2_031097 [Lamellibrachia satsuma]